ncbi:hypothetical protein [Actinoplanes awajinensis]|uniref:Uncharacterized protein n=1 Tax=Actinoplanes awajinensis subsp. mycoplanecinus TaxID=135947 RepID=A0A101JQX8_9ACTN|nr:hypothetical protein [Actinoplanes awajinensis]KUL31460.1 hypothetical protein ADL15_22265 [Actinoplanes awajinensis subsp. mycoplanecinus]
MSTRALPYRTTNGQVTAESWTTDDGSPLGGFLPSWDYTSVLRYTRRIRIDVPAVIQQCGLSQGTLLAVNVRYWPTTSLIRRTALHLSLEKRDAGTDIEKVVEVLISSEDLAGAVVLETTLVVEAGAPDAQPFTARRPGSVLWSDQHTVRLEGGAGLLPVAPVSFKEQGLPAEAAWYISVDSAEWGSAAMGNLLVLINDDNPHVKAALSAPHSAETAVLWDALTVDLVCDLVGRALEDDEFTHWPTDEPREPGEEITTAALVHALIRGFLRMPAETLEEAIERIRDERRRDPSRMRATAQNSLRFPGGHVA